jgi:hypothetical protein
MTHAHPNFTLTEDDGDGDWLAARLGVSTDALADFRPRYKSEPILVFRIN